MCNQGSCHLETLSREWAAYRSLSCCIRNVTNLAIGSISSSLLVLNLRRINPSRKSRQNQSQVSLHIFLIGQGQREDIMFLLTEIYELEIHEVALVNGNREYKDSRNIISLLMIRRRRFYPWFRDIFRAAGVSTNYPKYHPRTHI